MTRRKKIISVLIASIIILSALFVFPFTLTANAASVTIGSSLLTNPKNLTIKGTDDGLALRVDQKEYAYAEWATALPMNDFSMDFKIIDDNFEKLELTFTSMYDENVSNNYNSAIASPTEENIRKIIQPEKIKNIITLTKESNGIGVVITEFDILGEKIQESSTGIIGSIFKDFEFTVSYNGSDFIVKDKNGSGQKTVAVNPIINNEANLRIEFPKDSIKEIRKDVKDENGEITEDGEGASTLLITNISYKNTNSNETQNQSLKGTSVEDASKPILKADLRLLSNNDVKNNKTEVFVPVGTQYKIPVYGVDVIKSSTTLTIRATVNYYELELNPDYDSGNPDSKEFVPVLKNQILNNSSTINFQVNKIDGYYLIEKLTIFDGTHTVTFENKGDSIKNLGESGEIPMPIYVQGVNRTTEADKTFAFNITEDYANLFKDLDLKGGSKNKVVFPRPQVLGDVSSTTGVRSYVEDEERILQLENPYNIQYKLYYQTANDNPDDWSKSTNGLEFTATSPGVYKFRIAVLDDRQGNGGKAEALSNTIITLNIFVDAEIPEISVNSFPDEVIVNQKFTIPSASLTDNFITSSKMDTALYYLNEDGSYDKSDRIELASDKSFTPDEDMLGKEFIVVYNAKKGSKEAVPVVRTFKVVEAPPAVGGGFELTTLSIVFLSLGIASLLGIIAVLLIKPKEKNK